jgi:hypothetical protein
LSRNDFSMRAGVFISVCGHVVALLLGLLYAGADPFDQVPAEAISVDIVTPDQMAASDPTAEPETPPKPTFEIPPDLFAPSAQTAKSAQSNPSPPAQQAAGQPPSAQPSKPPAQAPPQPAKATPAQPPQQTPAQNRAPPRNTREAAVTPPLSPPPMPPPPQPAMMPPLPEPEPEPEERAPLDVFGMPLMLPDGRVGGSFDAPAYDKANIGSESQAVFRQHLRTCSALPAAVSRDDNIRIVLRVSLRPDGTLAAAPTLIEASASAKGPLLMESAINALRQCQPYTMLPADRYKEWKVLDLSFTPRDMAGG